MDDNPLNGSNFLSQVFWSIKNLEDLQSLYYKPSCPKIVNEEEGSIIVHDYKSETIQKCKMNLQEQVDQSRINIVYTKNSSSQQPSSKVVVEIIQISSSSLKYSKTQIQREQQIIDSQNIVESQRGIPSRKQLPQNAPTISRKQYIQKIENAISFLVQGIEVQKYCFRLKKIERCILFFSEDLNFMGIRRVIDGTTKIVKMKQCLGQTVGINTQTFKNYSKSGYPIKEQTTISILFPNRSYDFTLQSEETRDRLLECISFLQPNYEK